MCFFSFHLLLSASMISDLKYRGPVWNAGCLKMGKGAIIVEERVET